MYGAENCGEKCCGGVYLTGHIRYRATSSLAIPPDTWNYNKQLERNKNISMFNIGWLICELSWTEVQIRIEKQPQSCFMQDIDKCEQCKLRYKLQYNTPQNGPGVDSENTSPAFSTSHVER